MILSGPTIFTNDGIDSVIANGAVVIRDGVIEKVGDIESIRLMFPDDPEENLGDGLMTPGLVNLHHHLYSTFARGWSPGGIAPTNFVEILERIWWKLDRALRLDDIYYSALVALCESVLSGVTTVIDHHSSQSTVSGSIDMLAMAYDKVGISGSSCFELSDRAGADIFEKALRETSAGIGKWGRQYGKGLFSVMVGLHASMTLSDHSLKKIVEMFGEQGVGYHFHLAEDQSDQYDAITKYGKRVSERLDEFGIINDKSLAVHGVHLNETEIEILSGKNMNLALCPRSNQNNAVGFPAWWDYKNIKIGLGTDGIGSDILSEARAALHLSRLLRHDPDFGFEQTKKMLLENNPLICEIITGAKVGRIAPGYRADLVFWRYNAPTPLKSENIWGHYLYGLSCQAADSVWSCGRPILRHGRFTEFDYDEILARARALAAALWERI